MHPAAIKDDKEPVSKFGPLLVSESSKHRPKLTDLALDLATKSAAFSASLQPELAKSLAYLIRSMNCYYSNLIEGHNTHPIDIERALDKNFSDNPEQRDLQFEAAAHIAVQKSIDENELTDSVWSTNAALQIHKQFYGLLPDSLLKVSDPDTNESSLVVPGELRQRYVKVGRLVAISPGAVPRFLIRLFEAYQYCGKSEKIIAVACSHHRFLWIHPFLDGNGRVARLLSYAMLQEHLGTQGLWSIARGLARNSDTYKQLLAAADRPREGDLDGRGALSEQHLANFAEFFLQTCIDQVEFMSGLMDISRFRDRVTIWAKEEIQGDRLPKKTDRILNAIILNGALPRTDIADIIGLSERSARRTTSALIQAGVLTSETSKSALKLRFHAATAGRWLPGLFPERN